VGGGGGAKRGLQGGGDVYRENTVMRLVKKQTFFPRCPSMRIGDSFLGTVKLYGGVPVAKGKKVL